MAAFQGKPPGAGAGDISRRTERLRPPIALSPAQVSHARRLRRAGGEPDAIAAELGAAPEEVEKALLQMRSRRPETTRGTLNVTLAAHRVFLQERIGDEPLWKTVDRVVDELLRLRAGRAAPGPARPERRAADGQPGQLSLLADLVEAGPGHTAR